MIYGLPSGPASQDMVLAVNIGMLSIKTAEFKGWRDSRIDLWNPHVRIQCHLLAPAGTKHAHGTHIYIQELIHTHKIISK